MRTIHGQRVPALCTGQPWCNEGGVGRHPPPCRAPGERAARTAGVGTVPWTALRTRRRASSGSGVATATVSWAEPCGLRFIPAPPVPPGRHLPVVGRRS
jgi:hypothetical protein